MVAIRKARPGELEVAPGNANKPLYAGFARSSNVFGGAIFLMALALFPMLLANSLNIPFLVASLFGGTSLLIMVGVTLDTMSQLESFLTMRNYEGFLKKGRLQGRSGFTR